MAGDLAPIGLSAYSRVRHLQQTVAALQENALAKESDLYVFSDAPKAGDEEKVAAVRRFLRTIGGFKSVQIFERQVNNRVANNRGGMRMLLERFGKLIFVEEDAVCAPLFLSYMNQALEVYGPDPRVFAVCGYFPSIAIPTGYAHDVVLSPRMNAWAFGIWKDRFDRIEMGSRPEMFSAVFDHRETFREYCSGGYAVIPQLKALSAGKVDGLDIRIDYTMLREGRKYAVCPARSLVRPIGCDGSGEHWKHVSTRHDVDLAAAPAGLVISTEVQPDGEVISRLRRFNNEAVPKRLRVLMGLHRWGCYRPLKWCVDRWREGFAGLLRWAAGFGKA